MRPEQRTAATACPSSDAHLEHGAAELGANRRLALRPELTREEWADDDRARRHRDDVLLPICTAAEAAAWRLLRFGRAPGRGKHRGEEARARPVVPAAR
jgi:hypothetical protein